MLDLYKVYYSVLPSFPKKHRYTLGAHIENNLLQIIDNLLQAGAMPRENKYAPLLNAHNKLEMLKIFVRLARDLKLMDNKKYLALEQRVAEIGRMLGGWMKFIKQAAP